MARSVAIFGIVVMCMALVYGFGVGNLWQEGSVLTSMPWGIVTLIDFYVGILLFSAWVWLREESTVYRLLWTLSFVFLGNLATAIYLLKAAFEAKGDLQCLMLGRKTWASS